MESPLDNIHQTYQKIITCIEENYDVDYKIKITSYAEKYLDKLVWYIYHELDARAQVKNRTVNSASLKKFLDFDFKSTTNVKFFKEENHKYFMQDCTNIKLPDNWYMAHFMYCIEKFIWYIFENCIDERFDNNEEVITIDCIKTCNDYGKKANFKNFDTSKIILPESMQDNSMDTQDELETFDVQIPKLKSLNTISI
jgi:hypothetical protein